MPSLLAGRVKRPDLLLGISARGSDVKLVDKVIIVTGGAHGIGRALCERFQSEDPRGIVVADVDFEAALEVAKGVGGTAVACDVADPQAVQELVASVESNYGQLDLFCANAGIGQAGGPELPDDAWRHVWDVNLMSHVYAQRYALPGMLARSRGYFLHTASAAGLLTELSSAPYAVTKHAVVALAEWLAITHADHGIGVSCLCPLGVRTRMLESDVPSVAMLRENSRSVEEVADCVVQGIDAESFLILPHPEVAEFFRRKAGDYERWLRGMKRLRADLGQDGWQA